MSNTISKSAILSFLNERLESRKILSGTWTTTESEIRNTSKIEILEAIIGNIERNMFDDEAKFNELRRLYEWKQEAQLNDDSFTVQDLTQQIIKLQNDIEFSN